ncbi:PREDICTED: cell division cycle protein 123 homolog [Priapulus caudatus]|uniref:Cell division cycle protein 123 homolog n=1 Tax=Priapulus caudatus TaxID=37621 RepID=A0ABM1E9N8_PRICU|nr:PREDICTED: cell division cycle protein 123 homolog [Priapulus caudatus]
MAVIIIALPKEVLAYLQDGGTLVLPEGSGDSSQLHQSNRRQHNDEYEDENWDTEDDDTEALPNFSEFDGQLRAAIDELGGSVFPRLNWSSPKDASWIAFGNTLKCKSPGDIYLLLKSSDFVTHDLTQPFSLCEDADCANATRVKYDIVLREWCEINPSTEFRCFVKGDEIIGISQRDVTSHYDFVEANQEAICRDILDFFESKIKGRFLDENYVFDAYRVGTGNVCLLDFNPFGPVTDSLLFTWDDLYQKTTPSQNIYHNCDSLSKALDFQYVESDFRLQPNQYGKYRVPRDLSGISSKSDPSRLIDLLKSQTMMQREEESSSSDDTNS